jgi:kynurenine aminotransferase
VILFEPYFDQYLPSITFNHGVPVYVPLHPPPNFENNPTSDEWKIDFEELRRAITPKTKMIVVNTPHNPVGKVFTKEELQKIADLAIEHNLIVMSDEVVRFSSFDLIVMSDFLFSTILLSLMIDRMCGLLIFLACGNAL